MTQILDSALRGLMVGNQQYDRNRIQGAQERAARMMTAGDRSGAARELMGSGQFGEAATMSNVSMTNRAQDARERAGAAAAGGNYGEASAEMFGSGDLEGGQRLQTEARNREAGAHLLDDPGKAAALQATGGDIAQATQIIDWASRADETERTQALNRAKIMGPILSQAGRLPYEQRRAFIHQNAQVLGGAGFTPEQVQQFDPSDDNIRALNDTSLGLEAVLGSYSQRVLGDEVRTYRTNPYGVEQIGSEAVPYSRDEARDDRRLELQEEGLEIDRQRVAMPNSTGDVLAPIMAKRAQGMPLTAGEQEIFDRYLSSGQQGGGFGFGAPPPGVVAPPAVPMGTNGAANANRSGIVPGAARPQQPAQPGAVARPQTDADFNALPVGALYIDPDDGQTYRKGR